MLADMLRHVELHLHEVLPLTVDDVPVHSLTDMEHDIVVARVTVVAVQVPVAGLTVNFDIAHPQRVADAHLRIEEVGPGVVVMQSRVDDLHRPAVGGRQLSQRPQFVLPSVV
jgi:hypothetical protein